MVSFRELSGVALLIASGVIAAPWDHTSRYATHRVRRVGPAKVKLTSYHPSATFETYGVEGVDHPLNKRGVKDASPSEAAKSFLESKLGIKAEGLSRNGGHTSDVASFEYFHQTLNGLPVANAVANVALKNDRVTSFGASFVKPKSVADTEPKLSKEQAVSKAEEVTGATYTKQPTTLEYIAKDNDHVVLTHVVQVHNTETLEWYQVYVDAHTGEVVNLVDFVAEASYRVVPLGLQNPTQGYAVQTNPADATASPNGWHSTSTTDTSGNNVISYKTSAGTSETTTQSSATNNYDYAYDKTVGPGVRPNVDAARVNAFYVGNAIHDLAYIYGFDEASYNFQNDNYGKGGTGYDRVQISVQDNLGLVNNAAFTTLPDGLPGFLRMFPWDYTTPNRDGALENDILVHEYGHGISNRLTGGGTASCLQSDEARGLGEGWSDALADLTQIKSKILEDLTLGSFVMAKPGGIRSYPYSTNKTTNPLTYGSLGKLNEEHDVGEVWALIWHEVIASLLTKYGFSNKIRDPTGTAGNIVAWHLFIDAFKLQPCNPTFLTARDAIIQADANRYGGANKCLLWRAFAKRGLGTGATSTRVDSTTVPSRC